MNLVLNVFAPIAGKLVERTAREWVVGLRGAASAGRSVATRARRWALTESELLGDVVTQGRAHYEMSRNAARTAPPDPQRPAVAARGQNAA